MIAGADKERALDMLRMLHGDPPHNGGGNFCRGDGYFAASIVRQFGMSVSDLELETGYRTKTKAEKRLIDCDPANRCASSGCNNTRRLDELFCGTHINKTQEIVDMEAPIKNQRKTLRTQIEVDEDFVRRAIIMELKAQGYHPPMTANVEWTMSISDRFEGAEVEWEDVE